MQRVFSILFFCYIHASVIAQVNLSSGLVAHYPFNGNALDASGNNHHGTVSGATLTTDRFGTPNSAYAFDGVDDFISYATSPAFYPQLPVTITAWVYINDYSANPIFNNDYQEDEYNGVILNIYPGILASSFGDSGPSGPGSRRTKLGNITLSLGTWYHVAGIIRGPFDMTLYINGKEDCGTYSGSGGSLTYAQNNGASGVLDGNTTYPPDFFHGKIDDIRFYNRELNEAEIAALQDVTPGLTFQNSTICQGESLVLWAPPANTYSWTPSAGLSCTSCQTPTASPSVTTTYQVISVGQSGCPDTFHIQIVIDPCDTCFVVGSAIQIEPVSCFGANDGGFTLTASGGTPPYQYQLISGSLNTIGQFSGLAAGVYQVAIQDAELCRDTVQVTIPAPAPLNLNILSQQTVDCFGNQTGAIITSISGGTPPYQFSLNNGPGQPNGNFSSLGVGFYTVTATDAQGCLASISTTITGPQALFTSAQVTPVSCTGASTGSVQLSSSGGAGGYQYSIDGLSFSSGSVFSGLLAGSYTFWTRDGSNCLIQIQVAIPEPTPLVGNVVSQTGVNCTGSGTATLSADGGTPPYTYSSNGVAYQSSPTLAALGLGTQTLYIQDSEGCTATTVVQMIPAIPVIISGSVTSAFNGFSVSCFGYSDGSAQVAAAGGTGPYAYSWSQGATGAQVGNLSAGTYTIVASDLFGCSDTLTLALSAPPALQVSLNAETDYSGFSVRCADSKDGAISAIVSGGVPGYEYSWSVPGTSLPAIQGLGEGYYTVLVTDRNACIGRDTLFLNAPDSLRGEWLISPVSCYGGSDGSFMLAAGGGVGPYRYVYQRDTLPDGFLVDSLTSGNYIIRVIDENDCAATFQPAVPTPSEISVVIDSVKPARCNQDNGEAFAVASGGNGSPYSFQWQTTPAQTGSHAVNLAPGTYLVLVQDRNGCLGTASAEIESQEPPVAAFEIEDTQDGDTLFLHQALLRFRNLSEYVTGGYEWNFGDGSPLSSIISPTHTFREPGTYTIVLTAYDSFRECPDRDSMTIVVIPEGRFWVPSGFSPNSDAINDTWFVTGFDIKSITIRIFSRWGMEVATLNSLDQSWAGTSLSGRPLPEGVYVYRIEAVLNSGRFVEESGTITLIR